MSPSADLTMTSLQQKSANSLSGRLSKCHPRKYMLQHVHDGLVHLKEHGRVNLSEVQQSHDLFRLRCHFVGSLNPNHQKNIIFSFFENQTCLGSCLSIGVQLLCGGFAISFIFSSSFLTLRGNLSVLSQFFFDRFVLCL